ncbi:MAG: uroporphyrinogen decarboxylase [Geminicoccaceae bacterium]|nr:MAG: uroporphyrinogen decarboxylase [Geminicoccaceae bacterium]
MLRALAGERLATPPVWLMRQAGRYLPEYRAVRAEAGSFLDLCYRPDLAAEVTLQPIRRYPLDAAILFSDILVVPQALGRRLWFVENEGPKLAPIEAAAEIEALDPERIHTTLAPVYETVSRVREALPETVTLIGFSGAPWTLACYMIDGQGSKEFMKTRAFALSEPRAFELLIDRLEQAIVAYLGRQIEAGAEVVKLFDSWAGVLPPAGFERFCKAPLDRIVRAVKAAHPSVPVIAFPRGVGANYAAFAADVPVDGLALDTTVPMAWAASTLNPKITLQGNLDPVTLMVGGLPLDEAVDRIRAAMAERAHVFNLGHGVLQWTDPENVTRLLRRLKGTAG